MITKKLRIAIILFILLITISVLGYHFIEGMSFFNALYMTVITITTVGFGEVFPLSTAGRTFTMIILVFGVGLVAYTLGELIKNLVEGEILKVIGRRKLEKAIKDLNDHYIICGYGRVSKIICQELEENGKDFVVVEKDYSMTDELIRKNYLFIENDATLDETLIAAGIKKAKAIVASLREDTDNVYITLTARVLNPEIFILSRASEENSDKKMMMAGANKVISPHQIGGKRMAQALLRPSVADFIEIATTYQNLELQMEESVIAETSKLSGKSILDSNIRKEYNVFVIGIKKYSGKMFFNPDGSTVIEKGDILILLGRREDLDRLNKIIK